MSYTEPKKFTATAHLSRLTIKFEGEKFNNEPILDTKVTVEGGTLCAITWAYKEKFITELNEVISKYNI